jgi:tRNA threonylcarbamoyladenosine biosynthesis protein TsaE
MGPRMSELSLSLPDAAATRALGGAIAAACPRGTVILLRGPLGAGKTTFVQGFVEALGAGPAASPTFVLAHDYSSGTLPLWHLDLYRIEDPREIDQLDLAHYMPSDGITLVEWPERAPHAWPDDRIEVDLAITGESRTARVRGFGAAEAALQTARQR